MKYDLLALCSFGLAFTFFSSTSTSHQFDARFADSTTVHRSFHDSVYARQPDEVQALNDSIYAEHKLVKRAMFNIDGSVSANDRSYINQAFLDMQAFVTYVAANPNPQILARYFGPNTNAQNNVTAIFDTVRRMALPNGLRPANSRWDHVGPYDLGEITIQRPNGGYPKLAESFNVRAANVPQYPLINIYNFGWGALWKRRRANLECGKDIGPKVNFKMHFLGSLLFHEVMHFNNIVQIAWDNVLLTTAEFPDDQEGNYPCFNNAYGPWEATQLRQRDAVAAKVNIENYVWYGLETYSMHECRNEPKSFNSYDMFTPAESNDIWNGCIPRTIKGTLVNFWCWVS